MWWTGRLLRGALLCGPGLAFNAFPSSTQSAACAPSLAAIEEVLAGRARVKAPLVLPGSFNPLHEGHITMMQAAARSVGASEGEVVFELAVRNADKGAAEAAVIARRVEQFRTRNLRVCVTTEALFKGKSEIFQNSRFVIGQDTASRVTDAKYYGGTEEGLITAMNELRANGCSFVVAGRVSEGKFLGVEDVPMPPVLRDMFVGLSEQEFRLDISSSELRAQGVVVK